MKIKKFNEQVEPILEGNNQKDPVVEMYIESGTVIEEDSEHFDEYLTIKTKSGAIHRVELNHIDFED